MLLEAALEDIVATLAGAARARCQLHVADQADGVDVDHVGQVTQVEQRVLPVAFQFGGPLERVIATVDVQGHRDDGAGYRVVGIGIAAEESGDALRALYEGGVDPLVDEYGTHQDAAIGQPLGTGQQVRDDTPALHGEGFTDAAETGDHFVEGRQGVMPAGDLM